MSRYTINIGDEFPLNDEAPGASDRRIRFGLRALFVLALAAIVLTHPFHTLVLVGLALLVRRSRVWTEMRGRWRDGYARHQAGRARRCDQMRAERNDRDRPDRYKAFV